MTSVPHSELALRLNYDSIPLSKRIAMSGTVSMTKNSLQTEVNWGAEINRIDPHSGYTPLMVAAINGNPESVKTLIDRGAEIDYKEPIKGRTALICACKKGNETAVDMLLHKGAALSVVDNNGMHPLMWAAKNGHLACCKVLVGRGAGVNAFDLHDWTAMHFAAKYGHREVVDYLANSGASIVIKEKLEEGKTPLMLAAQYGRRETCYCLLDRGAEVNAITTRDELSALMLASKEGHKGTVRALIERGADANMSDSYGWTPLHFCASWGRRETAKLLIREGGANVDAMPIKRKSAGGGTTPLIIAAKGQQVDIITLLLDHGANASLNDAASGKNPLAIAAQEGFTASVSALIEHDVDLNVRDNRRMTPLMLAVVGGHAETIRLLLAACADITLLDIEEKSALAHARDFDREDIYLSAILKSSAAGKATVVPWIEMDVPKMIRGSTCGGPSVFLNSILYSKEGLFAGLFLRSNDQDVHLLHDLCMLAAAMAKSRFTQPLDAHDLDNKINEIDEMLLAIMDSMAFAVDHNLSLSLSLQGYPEAMETDGGFDYKYFSPAFATGPLALYLENDLSKMLTSYQMTRVINEVFQSTLRSPGESVGDRSYGNRSPLLRARYCPSVMFVMEGVSKLLMLALVTMNVQTHKRMHSLPTTASGVGTAGNNALGDFLSDSLLEQVLFVWIVTSVLYELGAIEEKLWSVSPSLAVDPHELKARRRSNAYNHFFCDIWHWLDFATLLMLVVWLVMKFVSNTESENTFGYALLSISAIPLSVGLLRYPGGFYRQFGQVVLSIFIITGKLLNFAVIFAMSGLGFGIAFTGMFNETGVFNTPFLAFRTLFNAINYQYDMEVFDTAQQQSSQVGAGLMVIFILWTVIILMNTLIAYIVSIYPFVNEAAGRQWLLLKSHHIQQYMLVHEKSPLCMLPAPLNAIPAALYPFHQIITWRARLYMKWGKLSCVSVAGSASDLLLRALFLIPAVFVEFYYFVTDAKEKIDERYGAIIMAPFELVSCFWALLYKTFVVDAWTTSVLLKSRLAKGRLRVAYNDSRDGNECIGVDDNVSVGEAPKEWVDNGGGGKNSGLSKYAQVRPEGLGEATILEPLGDQSSVWAKELGDMVDRNGIQRTRKNSDGSIVVPFAANGDMLANLAFRDSLSGSDHNSEERKDANSIDPRGVNLGVGKGTYYDHNLGFNAGRNAVELAKISGLAPPASPPASRPTTKGARIGESDEDGASISMMSDISSGELMQRFPPQTVSNNDLFVRQLHAGMFSAPERRAIFEVVIPEIQEVIDFAKQELIDRQARMEARKNGDAEMQETDDMAADPMYALFQSLENRIASSENNSYQRFQALVESLQSIKQKTDFIKDRPKLRPADFE